MSIWTLARTYYMRRGLPWLEWSRKPRGDKFGEEAQELRDALAAFDYDDPTAPRDPVLDEIGDVAITLAWIAECHGTTVEACMWNKTEKDAGRGIAPRYMAGT